MDSSDDEDLQNFLSNLCTPIINAEKFFKDHGLKWDPLKPDSSKADDLSLQQGGATVSLQEHFEKKLSEFEEKLFGEGPRETLDSDNKLLENLATSIEEELFSEDTRPTISNWRNETSLLDKYLTVPQELLREQTEVEKNIVAEKLHAEGIKFLSTTFKQFQPGPSYSLKDTYKDADEVDIRRPRTLEELAEIVTKDDVGTIKNNINETKSIKFVENEPETKDLSVESKTLHEDDQSSGNKSEEKEKSKGKKYEPKNVDILWSDPRKDPEFANELNEFMKNDSFPYNGEKFVQQPELDDLVEEASLPRNIIEMVTSATDQDYADWEYSILGDAEDSDEDLDEIAKKGREVIKNSDKCNRKQTDLSNTNAAVSIDTSDFLQEIMPQQLEDIIGTRDANGEVDGYSSTLRFDKLLIKEFEWTYKNESESEEESEEEEDEKKPEDEEEELGVDKAKEQVEKEDDDLTEAELKYTLESAEKFVEQMQNEEQEKFDPKLKEQMQLFNTLLDKLHIPKAGNIESDNLKVTFHEEVKKYDHIRTCHLNQKCPPGKLVAEISPVEEDELRNQSLNLKGTSVEQFETIFRPAQFHLNLPEVDGGDDTKTVQAHEELEEPLLPTTSEMRTTSRPRPTLFQDDDHLIADIKNVCEEDHNIFDESSLADSNSSSDDESKGSSTEEEESTFLDDEFKKEYFKRGGTEEGLADIPEIDNPDRDTLKTYVEKCFTFPYISNHFGNPDTVRMRRVIAQCFPEFRDEAFTDLSKDLSVHLSEPDDSSSEESVRENITLKTDPFEVEDYLKTKFPKDKSYDDDEDIPSAGEDVESDFEPIVPNHTLEKLENEVKLAQTQKRKRRRKEKTSKITQEHSSGESDEESIPTEREQQCINALWAPIHKFKQPSEAKISDTMKELHKLVILRPSKLRTPKYIKSWIKGKYKPTKETLRNWKKLYLDFYGNETMQDKVINSDKQSEYETFLESIQEELHFTAEETHVLKKFKKLYQERKTAKEQKDKADLIISSGDAPDAPVEEPLTMESDTNNVNAKDIDMSKDENTTEVVEMLESMSLNEEVQADLSTQKKRGSVIRLKNVRGPLKKEEWAEEVNCSEKPELSFTPAMTFSFELDGFQLQAIAALEGGYNVFVSAHTSAGKTVVAEYAIAMSKRNRSKAVYTSPVKALSNQKYADFKRVFGSVGLITGDIQLNENAECLIMTTEILRSMLYNSSEKIRDLQFVVFDEVHYINDPERGHVWEEVLILLSSEVQVVMLSATVPNTLEFANWVGRTKQRKVVVCATQHRPVPLNHYLYTGTGGSSPGNTYLLKSADGLFLLDNYQKAEAAMKESQERERQNRRKQLKKKMEEEREWKKKGLPGQPPPSPMDDPSYRWFKKDQTMWVALISFLEKKDWLPAVSFVFSRKKCDAFADMLSTVDLTTKSEKSFIHKFIKSQIKKLDEVDQDLPQIQIMSRQLDKGIGVHHSGILPVMKEIVEVLFQEGKVKFLFATETFAMGVNMPARTVIFHSINKFDGNDTRLLLPAEYVQMAGRAGRRGKDAAGNVIILAKPNDVIPRNSLETLLFGNPCKLTSKFRLTYRMILNTLTVSGMLTVQNMMERSYCENQGQLKRVFIQKDLIDAEENEKKLKKAMSAKVGELDVDNLSKFYDAAKKFIEEWTSIRIPLLLYSKALREICPGKLMKICIGSYVNRTAVVLETEQFQDDPTRNMYKVLILDQNSQYERLIAPDGYEMDQSELDFWYRMVSLMPGAPPELETICGPNDYSIISVKCHNIVAICKETIKLHKNILDDFLTHLKRKAPGNRNKTSDAGDNIARLLYSQTRRVTVIDEIKSVIENLDLAVHIATLNSLKQQIEESTVCSGSPLVMEAFRRVFRWKQALSKVEDLRMAMSVENMTLYPDFISKLALLKEKNYISDSEQVLMKGFMAARIGKYELVVCELLVENVLVDLEPEEVAALLSFLIYQTNSDDTTVGETLPASLRAAIEKCKKIMKDVTMLEKCYDIRDFEGSEISKLKFGLVPVMYSWAKQEPLKKIMEMPVDFDYQEGMLVRWIQQLLETLKEVESAARLMGDPSVPAKLQAAGQSIKRGIVFAPSIYTTM